eukprot:9483052-Pyramimonas_sp.AAC.1
MSRNYCACWEQKVGACYLHCEVFDKDTILRNDFLGQVEVSALIESCFKHRLRRFPGRYSNQENCHWHQWC